jgi:hypothetical protein
MALEPSGNISKGGCGQISGEQEDATPYQWLTGRDHLPKNHARGDRPSKFAGQDLPPTFTCLRLPVDAQPL